MKSIRLQNFRNLSDTKDIEIKPLTILVGCNSSGKSSFLRFFPLLKQSFGVQTHGPILWYKEDGVDFGDFATTVKNGEDTISICLKGLEVEHFPWRLKEKPYETDIEISIKREESPDSIYDRISKICIIYLENRIELDFIGDSKIHVLVNDEPMPDLEEDKQTFSSFFPSLKYLNDNKVQGYDELIELLKDYHFQTYDDFLYMSIAEFQNKIYGKEFNYNIMHVYNHILYFNIKDILFIIERSIYYSVTGITYIGPFRNAPLRYYRLQNLSTNTIDMKGSNMAVILNSLSDKEFYGFNKRLLNLFGFELVRKHDFGHISLFIKKGNVETNIVDNGFGYSQIMPILLALFCRNKSSHRLTRKNTICIEQPALHLHPQMQYQFGKALVECIKDSDDKTIIIETHSRSIIEAIGRAVYEDNNLRNKVVVYLFDSDNGNISVNRSEFDDDGYLLNWPMGFLD